PDNILLCVSQEDRFGPEGPRHKAKVGKGPVVSDVALPHPEHPDAARHSRAPSRRVRWGPSTLRETSCKSRAIPWPVLAETNVASLMPACRIFSPSSSRVTRSDLFMTASILESGTSSSERVSKQLPQFKAILSAGRLASTRRRTTVASETSSRVDLNAS